MNFEDAILFDNFPVRTANILIKWGFYFRYLNMNDIFIAGGTGILTGVLITWMLQKSKPYVYKWDMDEMQREMSLHQGKVTSFENSNPYFKTLFKNDRDRTTPIQVTFADRTITLDTIPDSDSPIFKELGYNDVQNLISRLACTQLIWGIAISKAYKQGVFGDLRFLNSANRVTDISKDSITCKVESWLVNRKAERCKRISMHIYIDFDQVILTTC